MIVRQADDSLPVSWMIRMLPALPRRVAFGRRTWMTRRDTPYYILIGLLSVQVAYGGYWAINDISARIGLWPDAALAAAFVQSLTLTQEVLFFSHVVMNLVTLVLVLRGKRWALPAFVLSFVLDRAEWVIMGSNNLFSTMVNVDAWTLFSFTLQGAIIAMLVFLTFEGRLR
ncbi:hypothetical protein [Maricaulis maris]|uniref:hypothetical protein n=1 Tax=Maricaulis maris TaxID=74318 RepID=UPI00117EDE5B|nr:hypothetical protein [Maricaulis maris]